MRRVLQKVQIAEQLAPIDAERVDVPDDIARAARVIELHLEPSAVLLGRGLDLLKGLRVDHHSVPERRAFSDQRDSADHARGGVDLPGSGGESNGGSGHLKGRVRQIISAL